MSEVLDQIQEAKRELAAANTAIKYREAALRLANDPDFKLLVVDGFMTEEALRCLRAAGDPLLDQKAQQDCLSQGLAAGHLKRYFSTLVQMGHTALHKIEAIQETLAELEDQFRSENEEADEPTDGYTVEGGVN